MFLANNRSAFQHPEFVSQAICEPLQNDCIIEHSTPPFCANPFLVAEGEEACFRHRSQASLKTFAHYLKSSKRGAGFLHGISGQGITMFTSVWSTSLSRFFLAFQWRAEIFYFCSFAFWP